jgi:hypothetical protein
VEAQPRRRDPCEVTSAIRYSLARRHWISAMRAAGAVADLSHPARGAGCQGGVPSELARGLIEFRESIRSLTPGVLSGPCECAA